MKDEYDLLEKEEAELRRLSPHEGAMGLNASDYKSMFSLFRRMVEDTLALRSDPNSLLNSRGQWDPKILTVYTKMIDTAAKILKNLNSMRNTDKMTSHLLESQTRSFANSVAVGLSIEFKELLAAIDRGESRDDLALRVKRIMFKRLPEIMVKSSDDTLKESKESFGLLH